MDIHIYLFILLWLLKKLQQWTHDSVRVTYLICNLPVLRSNTRHELILFDSEWTSKFEEFIFRLWMNKQIRRIYFSTLNEQANSKNCGLPPGKKIDLEIGQSSRSPYGTNRKGMSQWSCMPSINALSLILQKIWARLKFLWQTDGRTDRQMSFNVPRFRERLLGCCWVIYRINVALTTIQSYRNLGAGDTRSLKRYKISEIQVVRPRIEPRTPCFASNEL